jgi:hypothetical protein
VSVRQQPVRDPAAEHACCACDEYHVTSRVWWWIGIRVSSGE